MTRRRNPDMALPTPQCLHLMRASVEASACPQGWEVHQEVARRNPTRAFTKLEGYTPVPSILTCESAKTRLGTALGYQSAILYMLPADQLYKGMKTGGFPYSGPKTICPYASEGCKWGCLFATGHGSFEGALLARARKTWLYINDRDWFAEALTLAVANKIRQAAVTPITIPPTDAELEEAERRGEDEPPGKTRTFDPIWAEVRNEELWRPMIPVFRLNGTSDIQWELPENGAIPQRFPGIMFYDYTKWPLDQRQKAPKNLHLTYSYSDRPEALVEADAYLRTGRNVAAVWRTFSEVVDVLQAGTWRNVPVIDGDRDDLRFLDPQGVIVALFGKVSKKTATMAHQREDPHGFFLERLPEVAAAEGWAIPPLHARDPESPASAADWAKRDSGAFRIGRQRSASAITTQKKKFWHDQGLDRRQVSQDLPPEAIAFHLDLAARAMQGQFLAEVEASGFTPALEKQLAKQYGPPPSRGSAHDWWDYGVQVLMGPKKKPSLPPKTKPAERAAELKRREAAEKAFAKAEKELERTRRSRGRERMVAKNPRQIPAWRIPDAQSPLGDWALWWGPSREYEQASSMLEVEGTRVTQYDALAGYEGFGPDDWRSLTVDLAYAVEGRVPRAERARAALGAALIAEGRGVEEALLVSAELPRP